MANLTGAAGVGGGGGAWTWGGGAVFAGSGGGGDLPQPSAKTSKTKIPAFLCRAKPSRDRAGLSKKQIKGFSEGGFTAALHHS